MKSSKKILGASAALGLAIALSAGSTFAWFTKGNTNVGIDSFDFNATAEADGANLEIALTYLEASTIPGGSFGTSATFGGADSSAVTTALNALLAKELKPVTYNTTAKNFKDGTASDAKDVTDGYITFRIAFKSNAALNIYLDDSASVTPSGTAKAITSTAADPTIGFDVLSNLSNGTYGGISGTDYNVTTQADTENASLQVPTGDASITARAANAVRIMFHERKTGTNQEPNKRIWCPNEYKYDGSAQNSSAVLSSAENPNAAGFFKGNLASDYVEAVRQMREEGLRADEVNLGDSSYTSETQVTYSNCVKPYGATGKTSIATLVSATDASNGTGVTGLITDSSNKNFYAVVDVTVWLEGTDGDCFDAILGDAMSILLKFKGEDPSATQG